MIRRSKHSQNFTVLPNEIFEQITDGLAIGILAYLLSKPQDWNVTKQHLYKHFRQGRQSIDRSFKILEDAGYIYGEQIKDDKSRFTGFSWIVTDKPDPLYNSVFTENRLPENPQPESQQLLSNIELSTEEVNKESTIDYDGLLSFFNKTFNKRSRVIPDSVKAKYRARLKDGFTKKDILLAMTNAAKDEYHIETKYKYCTIEFFSRADKIDRFMSMGTGEDFNQEYNGL